MLAVQYDAIAERLTAYAFSGVARDDGQRKGEWSSIGYPSDHYPVTAVLVLEK